MPNNPIDSYSLFGVSTSALTKKETVERVIEAAQKRSSYSVAFMPVHSLMVAQESSDHSHALATFDIITADGQPVRWLLNHLYNVGLKERVSGPDTTLDLCKSAAEQNLSVYFYGSSTSVLEKLTKNLQVQFPKLKIAGTYSPPYGERKLEEIQDEIKTIQESGADILFVGLGCPKQEAFVAQHKTAIGLPILAVGAAFDFHAGTLAKAPLWMQKAGLEWLFRLIKEPRRLFKRYFYYNSWFLWKVIGTLLSKRTNSPK